MRGADWIGNGRTIRDSVRGFGLPDSIGTVVDVCHAGRLLVFCDSWVINRDSDLAAGGVVWTGLGIGVRFKI